MLGPEEFYVSNDVYFKNSLLRTLEFVVPIFKLGKIAYHNGARAEKSVDFFVDQFEYMPNGVSIDEEKK